MNVDAVLRELTGDPAYAGQIVHTRDVPARKAEVAGLDEIPGPCADLCRAAGFDALYTHQADALRASARGEHVLVATGTASGKSLCYQIPLLATLRREPAARAILLFPTKALCQDQYRAFERLRVQCGFSDVECGVLDGDTPAAARRRLRDHAAAVFTNPDMLHAALMPQHARWSCFLARLRLVVIDELHVYSGIFGANMRLLLHRLFRLCAHYGADPRVTACSATIANPRELAEGLTGRPFRLIDRDGSPRGRRVTVFWNPPRVRATRWRSRRSANVEAHEIMTRLLRRGVPTITFSKARVTAEMIYRYVCDALRREAPRQVSRVTPYRGGYNPADRRDIERRLFAGDLIGVSTTAALELGIDVGALDACIIVGYPGARASFHQQSGRAGRKAADSLVILIGLDTSINQYVMSHPEYLFDRAVEEAVLDAENPFVLTGHLRCAAQEKPIAHAELAAFGPYADTAIRILAENRKVREIGDAWYHAAAETPQHEISLRNMSEANVVIEESPAGRILGEVDVYDAEPLVHPGAVYLHRGDTYLVRSLDLDRNIATVERVDVDYYTQPMGGVDVHHIDEQLREKPLGRGGRVYWGEVTAYARTYAYERIHFYSLDAVSVHGLDLPIQSLDTMAFWIVPEERSMEIVRAAGLDAHSGLRGIGYAVRMHLPLFMTCDTRDFSHTVGSVNSPWNAVFVFERYPHGLGFTAKAYERIHELLPAVYDTVGACPCAEGCPCCVGKPLRGYATWNVERGEASIPAKAAAMMILEHLLEGGAAHPSADSAALHSHSAADRLRVEQALRRRLERMRAPKRFHPIRPAAAVKTAYPAVEQPAALSTADVARRAERRRDADRALRRKLAKKIESGELPPDARRPLRPPGMKTPHGNLPPDAFPGEPAERVSAGDPLAARARKLYHRRRVGETEP